MKCFLLLDDVPKGTNTMRKSKSRYVVTAKVIIVLAIPPTILCRLPVGIMLMF